MDSTIRLAGGTASPRSVMSFRIKLAVWAGSQPIVLRRARGHRRSPAPARCGRLLRDAGIGVPAAVIPGFKPGAVIDEGLNHFTPSLERGALSGSAVTSCRIRIETEVQRHLLPLQGLYFHRMLVGHTLNPPDTGCPLRGQCHQSHQRYPGSARRASGAVSSVRYRRIVPHPRTVWRRLRRATAL